MPGTITFRPIEATITHNTSRITGMDPYCLISIGDQKNKSEVCHRGGKHPTWSDTIIVDASQESTGMIEVKDKSMILHDENIGSCTIDIQEIKSQGCVKKWYPITWKGEVAGQLLMEADFNSSGVNLSDINKQAGMGLAGLAGQDNLEPLSHDQRAFSLPNAASDSKFAMPALDRNIHSTFEKDFVTPESTETDEKPALAPQTDLFHSNSKELEGLDLTSDIGPHMTGYDKNLWNPPTSLKDVKL